MRRLLTGVTGPAAFSLTDIRTLTSSPQGGWTQIQDPKAVYYNGATYFGYAPDTGSTGDIVVGKYVHATRTTTTTVLASAYENPPDNHSSPAVLVRSSDHKIVVAAARHAEVNSPKIWISTNPEDISSFGAAIEPDPSIGAAQYTYMILYQLDSGTIILLYRDYISGTNTGRLGFSSSTDGGSTWAGRKILYTGATGEVPYWRVISDGTLLHVFVTDVEPDASALGHFYYDHAAGKVYTSAGVEIAGWNGTTSILGWSDITQVHAATAWSWGGSVDSLDRPATVMMVDIGSDNAVKVARWRSGAWQVNTVVASVGGQLTGNQYGSGCAIHHGNPDIVYVAKKATKWEMWRYVSTDDGVTWEGTQITSGSSVDNVWAEVVHNAAAGLEGIWLAGTYTSDTNYAFGISGYG